MTMSFLRREPGFYKRLWNLSLPIILQNLITFSLGLIDTFMVSQLGNTEMAAVTTANVPVFILISIVFGVQSGLGILVSQYWGKGDVKKHQPCRRRSLLHWNRYHSGSRHSVLPVPCCRYGSAVQRA